MEQDLASRVRVVLVEPSHPGNIGAAARAMKVMGLRRLSLVAPRQFPHAEATVRAAGADDLLAAASLCPTLDAAIADCHRVYGTTARSRSLRWPALAPRAAAAQMLALPAHAEVAVVFGRERTGLDNDEVARCHRLIHIPTAPDFGSLNLAAAVQVLAYELHLAALTGVPVPAETPEAPPATAAQMQALYEHLERALVALAFLDPDNPRQLMPRLRRFFNRAAPDALELNILRGILTAAERARAEADGDRRADPAAPAAHRRSPAEEQ